MSDADKDLSARLALLANETPEFDGDQRVLRDDDPFAAMMNLIDQTVIPALLDVSNGQRVLRLEVAGRRLSRLPGVVEDLSSDDADALTAAATHIAAFADEAGGPLYVRDMTSDAGGADPAQSVSIKALAAAAGRPLIDANTTPIDQFRARLGSTIGAGQITSGGKVSETIGDTAPFDAILTDMGGLASHAPKGSPNLILLEVDDTVAPLHGAVCVDGDVFAFVASGTTFAAILSAFKSSISA